MSNKVKKQCLRCEKVRACGAKGLCSACYNSTRTGPRVCKECAGVVFNFSGYGLCHVCYYRDVVKERKRPNGPKITEENVAANLRVSRMLYDSGPYDAWAIKDGPTWGD